MMHRLKSFKGVTYFYRNFLRGGLKTDHSHSRVVLSSMITEFTKDSEIGQRLRYINQFSKLEKQLDTEIDEVSKMIANEIPLQYRILHQIEEKLYRNGLVEYKTPIFERIVG